jgi:hypothetical protein
MCPGVRKAPKEQFCAAEMPSASSPMSIGRRGYCSGDFADDPDESGKGIQAWHLDP